MAQTVTLYILEKKDLHSLRPFGDSESSGKKIWLTRGKQPSGSFIKMLETFAREKIKYRWSGSAFVVLSVFAKEQLGIDWSTLAYGSLANVLSENLNLGIYIFSTEDEELPKLKPSGFFYTMEELNEFAIQFHGKQPVFPDIMKTTAETLSRCLAKLDEETVLLLLIKE